MNFKFQISNICFDFFNCACWRKNGQIDELPGTYVATKLSFFAFVLPLTCIQVALKLPWVDPELPPNVISYSNFSNKWTCLLILFKKNIVPSDFHVSDRLKIPAYLPVLQVGWIFHYIRLFKLIREVRVLLMQLTIFHEKID